MTKDELSESVMKFIAYLAANDVHVMCYAMYIDEGPLGKICVTGGKEMLTEMLLIATVDKHGWKVVPK